MGEQRRITRRSLLRSAFVGGTGLIAASVAGCGDDDAPPARTPAPDSPTVTPVPGEPTATPLDASPSPSPDTGPRWELMPITGDLPPARRDHSLVSDGQRLYLFGGRGGGQDFADFWMFDPEAGAWTEINGAGPSARFGHNCDYMAGASQIVVFGGQAGSDFLADTWIYSLDSQQWAERTAPPAPAARYGAASAYHETTGLIVSHGFTFSGRFDDTWVFLPANIWGDVDAEGARPVERCLTRGVWDEQNGRFLMFGGQANADPYLGDLWALSQGRWSEITPSGPSPAPRNFYSLTTIGLNEAVLFGGSTADGPAGDTWLLEMVKEAWSEVTITGEAPSPRSGHDSAPAPGERGVYLFGGEDSSGVLNDLWRLTVRDTLQAG